MYNEYFVLVTEKYFGIFEISAKYYPEIFKQNLDCVDCIKVTEIEKYLLEKVGRNSLVKSGFRLFNEFNKIYTR